MKTGKKYGYLWVTLVLFLGSLLGHWTLGWFAYAREQREKNRPVEIGEFVLQAGRDTLENWQSEFLQLIWQVAGLTYLLYVGSPQSKEGDDRREEKLDYLIRRSAPGEAENFLAGLDRRYPKR